MAEIIVRLSERELVSIGRSKEFRSRLASAARFTQRTGLESAFGLYRAIDEGADHWTPVFEGMTDCVPTDAYESWSERTLRGWPVELGYFALDVHFHPEPGAPIAYSENDLKRLSEAPNPGRPIVGVGRVADRSGEILLMQQRVGGDIDAMGLVDELMASPPECAYHDQLRLPGYIRTGRLQFRLSGRTDNAIVANPEVLRRFAYSEKGAISDAQALFAVEAGPFSWPNRQIPNENHAHRGVVHDETGP